MRLTEIRVSKLFGVFEHTIPLFMDDRITIIHGPNGFGKTTILKMVNDLFAKRPYALRWVPFSTLKLKFDDGRSLVVTRSITGDQAKQPLSSAQPNLSFELVERRKRTQKVPSPKEFNYGGISKEELRKRAYPIGMISEFVDVLERVDSDRWFDRTTGETLSLEHVIDRFRESLPPDFLPELKRFPDWLSEILDGVNIHFIETQRLFMFQYDNVRHTRKNVRTQSVVEQNSQDLAQKIQALLTHSGSLSASLDSTFPRRLLEETVAEKITEDSIRANYKQQNEYRTRLMAAGLIANEEQVPLPESKEKLKQIELRVLWHYLEDVKKKFEIFDDLLKKVELFTEIMMT